jgi:zinc metalloprotease ZmpB
VKGYHCKPSAGVLWPNDLRPLTTPQLRVGTLRPNNAEEKTVGPFEWTPVVKAWGHDCMLMIVSATGDSSNVASFTTGEVIEDWRLVPNDNNVAQRNVVLAPGGGGRKGLMAGLRGKGFWVGNPGRRTAKIAAAVVLPPLLAKRGWRINLRNLPADGTPLKARKQRRVTFDVRAGATFTKADAVAATKRDIVVTATANGAIIGGMIYRIDPALDMPFNDRKSTSARSRRVGARRGDTRRRRDGPAHKRRSRRARKRPV